MQKPRSQLPVLYEFTVKDTMLRATHPCFYEFSRKNKDLNTPSAEIVFLTFTHQELPEAGRGHGIFFSYACKHFMVAIS